ncbi:1,2-phenylacetyl-CoA epoxidase subunit PaaD [Phaeodactylibacter luteus]|uniref:Phenylacetate-CoA oxygenase subunit PaaJ n=1 Tax=Phaeodactylibacter luteus TaxID=1564516 RepID=A0A5C6RK11_9BACT|nr:1,2-phenylacetyl-CoA epoxidase subunit PaaD [Phaeodactylibacter luteus]TXB62249.1 phenylacetate-CoA oxygenase subunit PaaJ [Phaeodactylibacter luteus]
MPTLTTAAIWAVLEAVSDPEIPVLTVTDLGIVRDVKLHDDGLTEIVITPTYSGCPAMNTIEVNIRAVLEEHGVAPVKVTTVLQPAWTTDWMTERGRQKLLAYGIAPPVNGTADKGALFAEQPEVACPQCGSVHTELVSQFGSTACKAMYRCLDCREPFDYFKCH